jgi:glycosyltransferase involved in cell wall biosynthesis
MQNLTIIVPAYNEEEALRTFLPELLRYCREHGCHLIVVNDGSIDGTRGVIEPYRSDSLLAVCHHKTNLGYGAAIKTGIRNSTTDYVVTVDADGQHRLDDVARLYQTEVSRDADMVVGRRAGVQDSVYRSIGKRAIRFVARILMPLPVNDLNSGMKLYHRGLARNYLPLCPDNMAFSDIIVLVFVSQKRRVLEQEIIVNPRRSGVSTISTKTAFETVMEIINIVVLFNPMRIFLPLSLLFIAFGLIWGLPIILRNEGVSAGTLLLLVSGMIFFLLGLLAEQLSLIRKSLAGVK